MDTQDQSSCYSDSSIAGAVLGTFFTTLLLGGLAALLYRQWRRHKGKHLVLVTDPEIVDDAYAFDNPCFKDASGDARSLERPVSQISSTSATPHNKWSSPWTNLALAVANAKDKRRTLDDSFVGPKATRISVVSLRSRDFTGLGFNVCGNMREGIFVKDVLHRGPASESGRIHPDDRINSVKISFRNMVYEDALTILSYASPYDVELEVESACKPTTTSLMKKSVGSSPVKMCHPLYRSQSIPELSKTHHNKSLAKKLFISDLNDSLGSNHSKSTSHQTVDKRPDDKVKSVNNHHHHKFGIKVLPALDATVHRIENQNEHNTNLERRNSKKNIVDAEKQTNSRPKSQQRDSADESDTKLELKSFSDVPSEVPAEVHNAAMAARKNRKNSSELEKRISLTSDSLDEGKSPQKNKRKAPAPPESKGDKVDYDKLNGQRDSISVNETGDVKKAKMEKTEMNRKHSESDTDDSEMVQTGFTKIELNPADITIHHTPVPEVDNDDDDDDNDADIYRKAASLGDLSKYENKTATTLERAQSLDMTDTSLKKRKAPMPPPEDISESTEDLTKLDEIDPFNIRKLKKSSEWGTLEDVIWTKMDSEKKEDPVRKKSNGFMELEDQKVEDEVQKKVFVKLDLNNGHGDEEELDLREAKVAQVSENQNSEGEDEAEEDTAKQKQMNKALKYFDMNFKSPVSNEIKVNLSSAWVEDSDNSYQAESMDQSIEQPLTKVIIKYGCPGCEQKLGRHNENCTRQIIEAALDSTPVSVEKPDLPSPQSYFQKAPKSEPSATTIQVRDQSNEEKPSESMSSFQSTRTKFEQAAEASSPPLKSSFSCIPRRIPSTDSHFAKRIVHVNKSPDDEQNEGNEFRSGVTVNSKNVSANRHNVSNVSVSSGENSEDSGLVRESDSETRPAYVATTTPQKMTYITEIKVSPTNRDRAQTDEDHAPITSNGKPAPNKKPPVPPRRDAKSIKSDGSERQVVYVSEYKSPPKDKETTNFGNIQLNSSEHRLHLDDNNEQNNPLANRSSSSQPKT